MKLEVTEAAIVLRVAAIEADSTLAVSPYPPSTRDSPISCRPRKENRGIQCPLSLAASGADFHLVPGMGDERLCRERGGALEWVPLEVQSKRSHWVAPVGYDGCLLNEWTVRSHHTGMVRGFARLLGRSWTFDCNVDPMPASLK